MRRRPTHPDTGQVRIRVRKIRLQNGTVLMPTDFGLKVFILTVSDPRRK